MLLSSDISLLKKSQKISDFFKIYVLLLPIGTIHVFRLRVSQRNSDKSRHTLLHEYSLLRLTSQSINHMCKLGVMKYCLQCREIWLDTTQVSIHTHTKRFQNCVFNLLLYAYINHQPDTQKRVTTYIYSIKLLKPLCIVYIPPLFMTISAFCCGHSDSA